MATQRRNAAQPNLILRRLPAGEQRRLAERSEPVTWVAGEAVCGGGTGPAHVYFPHRGLLSVFAHPAEGSAIGVGFVRPDGVFGLGVGMGRRRSPLRVFSQGPGQGERIDALHFGRLLQDCPDLRTAVSAFADGWASQMACNVACVAFHSGRQRVARWMLDVTEGSQESRFSATQADIAAALGLQRPAVSRIATALQRSGCIRYLRGEVRILERAALREVACRCSPRDG